uniref:Uncharacterized protein n=1 Tax=Arundo donax TaxID=35708 RepID=A0A0A9C0T2_ARUDO
MSPPAANSLSSEFY